MIGISTHAQMDEFRGGRVPQSQNKRERESDKEAKKIYRSREEGEETVLLIMCARH